MADEEREELSQESAADDDDKGGDEEETHEPESTSEKPERQSRSERRASRGASYREMQAKIAEYEKSHGDLRSRYDDLERRYNQDRASHEQRIARFESGEGVQPSASLQKELDSIEADMDAELQAIDTATRAGQSRGLKQYRALERKRMGVILRMESGGGAAERDNPGPSVAQQMLSADYPWISSNDEARANTAATYEYLIRIEGRPAGLQTAREAAAKVAAKMKLGGPMPASRETQQRLAGVSSRDGAGKPSGGRRLTSQEESMLSRSGLPKSMLDRIAENPDE